jgi:hypothetical protein
MKDPIKIIHKFKNDQRRIQYKIYIFVGYLVPIDILELLNTFKNKNFTNTLLDISMKSYKILTEYYGIFWYNKFFISWHIKHCIKEIEKNNALRKLFESKYGKEWYNVHIATDNIKKITYSFASKYHFQLPEKKSIILKDIDLNFKTQDQDSNQVGGWDDDFEEIENIKDVGIKEIKEVKEINEDQVVEEEIIDEEIIDEKAESDIDLDELAKMYYDENLESDKNIKDNSKLISDAIHDKKWEKHIDETEMDYNDSLDNIPYDTDIENVFQKIFIVDEYIFKDDVIKNIKNKITVSIPLKNNLKLLPECQYLWSEYYNTTGREEIMIGQKWIKKNELLKIDVKPNDNLNVYENLRYNLSYLKESFAYKIKREDDDNNILRFYDEFMTLNEIYLIDIYNELGANYENDIEKKKNLHNVYVSIYFPFINYDRFESIISFLNNKSEKEKELTEKQFKIIKNDIKLEKEISQIVEIGKMDSQSYEKYFDTTFIIQVNIHLNINDPKNITGTTTDDRFNLYRIFDNYVLDERYPYIQYQTPDNQIRYKFTNKDNIEKWFETMTYGLSFKILLSGEENKYISVNLHENGRIEYKITWKEEDHTTIENVYNSYEDIKNLIKKINSENKKIKIMIPSDDRFNFAFINTIQKFTLPEDFKINHNDLSEFCRFFFTYISLVIEPKKRLSKKNELVNVHSKFGTYLRYRRINKYENKIKMHLRILYFIRNYDLNEKQLIDEIAKQFNITQELASREIIVVREKYGKSIKSSKKALKKLSEITKTKPPGIGIDIQGRDRDRYKIRITGIRNKEQLDEIVLFLQVLIYLYVQTYLYKKNKYEKIKEILKSLTKIATRRNKVSDYVNYEDTGPTVKTITNLDKKRLGFKPEKGQSQWTRSCQNSGNDKKRRPTIIPEADIEKLIKNGFKFNAKSGFYEKKVEITIKKKKITSTIKAVKLAGENNTYNYYTCDPIENQEHMHIGFLSKGNNPNNLCMPCCFKKDQAVTVNKEKKKYFLNCVGEKIKEEEDQETSALTDKVYILQDTNKIQNDRFIYLPKFLDVFFNQIWKHDNKIKNHYLYESVSGYYFKYTVKHDKHYFLAAIANILEISIRDIIQKIIDFLKKDENEIYFIFLNNGDIKEIFKTRSNFIKYIEGNTYLEYDILGELIALPNLFSKNGFFYFILNKTVTISKENDIISEKYYLDCLNYENNFFLNEDREFIIFIKDTNYYFPIYRIQKGEKDKKIKLEKKFTNNNIINELKLYYNSSCKNNLLSKIVGNSLLYAKNIIMLLKDKVKKQYIDEKNKCKYLLINENLILPVYPSGILYNFKIDSIDNIKIKQSYEDVIDGLKVINKILKMEYIPKSIFYDKKKDDEIRIISILLENDLLIPIKIEYVKQKQIKQLGLTIKFESQDEIIDKIIYNFSKNPKLILDQRHVNVRQHLYKNESYNIFRLEFSYFLEKNPKIKDTLIEVVRSKIDTDDKIKFIYDKKKKLRDYLFKIVKTEKIFNATKKLPDINEYSVSNIRDYCEIHKTKNKCNNNLHCLWKNECKMLLPETLISDFINKMLEEMIQDNIQFKELIQEDTYYVSDIVDSTIYTYRPNQTIISSHNLNLKKILEETFGKDKNIVIGKSRIKRKTHIEIQEDYPELDILGKQYIQEIISNKDSVIRAFINCYYWINNPLYEIESRNLGYYAEVQTILTNHAKAKIIDSIDEKYNKNLILNQIIKYSHNTNGEIELTILSKIFNIRIVVYNNFNNVIALYLQGKINVTKENINNFTREEFRNKTVFIKFNFDNNNTIPRKIYSIYYK